MPSAASRRCSASSPGPDRPPAGPDGLVRTRPNSFGPARACTRADAGGQRTGSRCDTWPRRAARFRVHGDRTSRRGLVRTARGGPGAPGARRVGRWDGDGAAPDAPAGVRSGPRLLCAASALCRVRSPNPPRPNLSANPPPNAFANPSGKSLRQIPFADPSGKSACRPSARPPPIDQLRSRRFRLRKSARRRRSGPAAAASPSRAPSPISGVVGRCRRRRPVGSPQEGRSASAAAPAVRPPPLRPAPPGRAAPPDCR